MKGTTMSHDLFSTATRDAVCKADRLFEGARILRLLHRLHWDRIQDIQVRRANVMLLIHLIATKAEGGKVCAIESGRDCDGVQYAGKVHTIDANIAAWRKLYDDLGNWADGPFSLSVASPSEARAIEYTSRDLVMEAHEDGHPHVIYSQFQ